MLDDLILCSACGEKIHNGSWHYGCIESGGMGEGIALDDLLEMKIESQADVAKLEEYEALETDLHEANANIKDLKRELEKHEQMSKDNERLLEKEMDSLRQLVIKQEDEIARLQWIKSPWQKG